jgi:hypothetical protein
MAGWTNRAPAAAVERVVEAAVVLDGESPPLEDLVMTGLEVVRTKEELAVGPLVLVELDRGKDAQVVEEMVVVEVCAGQLVAVGLH